MDNRVYGLIGIAKRARKTVTGETIFVTIRNKSAKIVLISDLASENTKKKLIDKCVYYHVPYYLVDEHLLNQALAEYNKKAMAIIDVGISQKIMQYMKG